MYSGLQTAELVFSPRTEDLCSSRVNCSRTDAVDSDAPVAELDGCLDVDIWPTPFTNTFPIRRGAMTVGERRQLRMAWIYAPDLTVQPQSQAYTRLADRLYLFENLDGSGFQAELPVDDEGVVIDYPDLFRRVPLRS